jgi:hypothetical protein
MCYECRFSGTDRAFNAAIANKMKEVFQMKRKITMMVGVGLLAVAVGYGQTPSPGQAPNAQSPNSPLTPGQNTRPGQNPDTPQTQRPAENPVPGQASPRAGTPAASSKTFEGRLTKVDAATKTITVTPLNPNQGGEKEMTFKYNDQTTVTGGDRTVQGLGGKTGSTLKVTYDADHESGNTASHIEINEK